MRPADQLLYDSEASLRLVDQAIGELGESDAELDRDAHGFVFRVMAQPEGFAELSRALLRAYAEALDVIQRATEQGDTPNGGRPRIVPSARMTAEAATAIIESAAHVLALSERLESASDADRPRLLLRLRDELNRVPNHRVLQNALDELFVARAHRRSA
jgi:hypothetical protein